MKTLEEVERWRLGVLQQFGDPSAATGQMFARYVRQAPQTPYSDVIATYNGEVLLVSFEAGDVLPIPIDANGMFVDDEGQLVNFGIRQICPGTWTVNPSLNMPGVIHAFLVIYDVPEPAPWVNRIIVVSSLGSAALNAL